MNGMQDPLGVNRALHEKLNRAEGSADDVTFGLLLPLAAIGAVMVVGYLLISAIL